MACTDTAILGYSLPMVALILPCGLWARTVSNRSAFTLAVLGFAAAAALSVIATVAVAAGRRGLRHASSGAAPS